MCFGNGCNSEVVMPGELSRCGMRSLLAPIGTAGTAVSDGMDMAVNGMTPTVMSVTEAGSSHRRILNGGLTGLLRRFAPRDGE